MIDKLFRRPSTAFRRETKSAGIRKDEVPAILSPGSSTEDCDAMQFSDSMHCKACGLSYDVNDSDPPTCPRTGFPARSSGRRRA